MNAVTAHVTQHALECCRVRVALHNGSAASVHSPLTLQHKSHVTRVCQVKSVIIVHVGGTRCVTSSIDHSMKIHVRITLTVEFIRTCIILFLFYVAIQL